MVEERIATLEADFRTLKEDVKEMSDALSRIEAQLQKQKGFIGGVVFLGSGVITFITIVGPMLAEWIKDHFK